MSDRRYSTSAWQKTRTSAEMIDQTYGHLLPDAVDRTRTAMDTFLGAALELADSAR